MTRGSEKILKALSIFSMFVICEGCASYTSVSLSSNQAKTVSMTANINRDYRVIKHIKVEQIIPFLFLVRLNPQSGHPEVDEMLQPEIDASQGDAIVNVKIKGEAAFGDVFLPVGVGVLGGIAFAPLYIVAVTPLYEDLKTYTVEGDIVKYTDVKKLPEPEQKFDPLTGLPAAKPTPRYDPGTGSPIKHLEEN